MVQSNMTVVIVVFTQNGKDLRKILFWTYMCLETNTFRSSTFYQLHKFWLKIWSNFQPNISHIIESMACSTLLKAMKHQCPLIRVEMCGLLAFTFGPKLILQLPYNALHSTNDQVLFIHTTIIFQLQFYMSNNLIHQFLLSNLQQFNLAMCAGH